MMGLLKSQILLSPTYRQTYMGLNLLCRFLLLTIVNSIWEAHVFRAYNILNGAQPANQWLSRSDEVFK